MSSADRQDSDADDSDGPDDDENDDNEEEEEDSQAESGLSTNPSVSASPQHLCSREAEVPPSSLLAQMSISSVSLPSYQCTVPGPDPEAVPSISPAYLSKQSYTTVPLPYCPPTIGTTTSDSCTSDTESVHMMSPVSPCRQMSIDYPDFDIPPSPPVPGKTSRPVQVRTAISLSASGLFRPLMCRTPVRAVKKEELGCRASRNTLFNLMTLIGRIYCHLLVKTITI